MKISSAWFIGTFTSHRQTLHIARALLSVMQAVVSALAEAKKNNYLVIRTGNLPSENIKHHSDCKFHLFIMVIDGKKNQQNSVRIVSLV